MNILTKTKTPPMHKNQEEKRRTVVEKAFMMTFNGNLDGANHTQLCVRDGFLQYFFFRFCTSVTE